MQILDIVAVGTDYKYLWPSGNEEPYPYWIEYHASCSQSEHRVRIGFGTRRVHGRERKRVVVWIDTYPHAEFLAADDFAHSGDVLSEIKVPGNKGQRICRYPDEAIPEQYSGLSIVGLPTRVSGPSLHNAWAVVPNIGDHRAMSALGALRRLERDR